MCTIGDAEQQTANYVASVYTYAQFGPPEYSKGLSLDGFHTTLERIRDAHPDDSSWEDAVVDFERLQSMPEANRPYEGGTAGYLARVEQLTAMLVDN